ncbi:MAG: hypothetical protein KH366_19780 [Clostridiaceae bacterium]|nr:hypothetical protein [Clostridiaceae bacterium]
MNTRYSVLFCLNGERGEKCKRKGKKLRKICKKLLTFDEWFGKIIFALRNEAKTKETLKKVLNKNKKVVDKHFAT